MLKQLLLISTLLASSVTFANAQTAELPSVNNSATPSTPVVPQLIPIPQRAPQRAVPNADSDKPEAPAPEASLPSSGKQPIGIPFPNAIKGADSKAAKTPLPLSTQSMALDPNHVDSSIRKAESQADSRLNEIRPGSGDLPSVDISGIKPELEQMSRIQRDIRMFELKQREADLAIKYWTTVYDGPREDAAAKSASVAMNNVGNQAADALAKESKEKEEALKTKANQQDNTQPFPKVVSILGAGGNFKAIVLVPYVGEVTARTGTLLPGNRRVTSISPNGVVIMDKGNSVTLGMGDSVALTPLSTNNQQVPSTRTENRR